MNDSSTHRALVSGGRSGQWEACRPDAAQKSMDSPGNLLIVNTDIHGFLVDVAIRISEELSSHGTTIHCAITVNVDERQRTLAASSPDARAFDELQSSYPAGPRLTAWQTHALIHVSNVAMEDRWSFFLRPAAARGLGSVLILPMDLDGAVEAAVNLYCPHIHGFEPETIMAAETATSYASAAIRLASKTVNSSGTWADMRSAIESRTIIDTAVGILMAQNRYTREDAFQVLQKAAGAGTGLRALAAGIIENISGQKDPPASVGG